MTADVTSEIPVGIAEDGAGNVYLLDANTSRIEKFTASGKFIGRYGFGNPGEVQQPKRSVGLSVDGAGNVFMLNAEASRIQKYSSSGQLIGAWGFGAPEVGTAGSSRKSVDAPVLEPKEAAPAPSISPSVGAKLTPDVGPVETMKQTVAAAPAVDMVRSTISGAAAVPGGAVGKGVDAVKSATSDAASVSAPVADSVGTGLGEIKTAASDVVGARGDGMKDPLRSEGANQAKHHWWQFWK